MLVPSKLVSARDLERRTLFSTRRCCYRHHQYTQTRFQKDTTPTRAGILFTLEPVISAVLAYFILGEILGMLGVLGGIIIVAGILISELSDKYIEKFHWKLKIADEE